MKSINKLILLLAFNQFILGGLWAQLPQNRAVTTIVADALAQLPANNPELYLETFTSLTSTSEEGLLNLIQKLKVPDEKSNEAVEFAISGWTNFVANDSKKREIAANTLAKALMQENIHKETKAFLIRQLSLIAGEGQVSVLSGLINDDYLSAPSVQTLSAIRSSNINNTLLEALKKTKSGEIRINLVNALAYRECTEAEATLLNLLENNPSEELKSALLMSLSRTGSKTSIPILKSIVEKEHFSYEKNNAVASYVELLNRLSVSNPKEVQREADNLLSKATQSEKQGLRVATMEILMKLPSTDKTKLLKSALIDNNKTFLTNTLVYYSPHKNNKGIRLILKQLQKSSDAAVKSSLIYWLGNEKIARSARVIAKNLQNGDNSVKTAAVKSLSKIASDDALQELMQLFSANDEELITLAKKELLTVSNSNLSKILGSAFPSSSDAGKAAVLEIIGARGMKGHYPLVLAQIESDNTMIKLQATKSLKSIVNDENLPELFNLLENSGKEYASDLQEALKSALSPLSPNEQANQITKQMNASPKKHLYYKLLANTGTEEAKRIIINDYRTMSGEAKSAAFEALTGWKTFDGVYSLLDIARNSRDKMELTRSVDAMTSMIATSKERNGEVKALYLREIMLFTQNDKQKNEILKHLGKSNSYKALLYLAHFMEQSALKETAAQSIMNIALNNPLFLDENTSKILDRVKQTLSNPDATYQRQAIDKHVNENPVQNGFEPIFNGLDLSGWKGLVGNPLTRVRMSSTDLDNEQKNADEAVKESWVVESGELLFTGKGKNLCTEKLYGDFELLVDWKLYPGAEPDAGIYLRGTPQVQIWDTARIKVGAQVGSGGLYNNKQNISKPVKVADEKVGEWNTFRIKMIGDRVTVYLNGELVTDNVIMENYWDRSLPIPALEQIELQAHGSRVAYRDIYIREIPRPEAFKLSKEEEMDSFEILFDGTNMHRWTGNTNDYVSEDGNIVIYPSRGFGGNLYTKDEFSNFIFRFEFMLTPGANNGLGIRTPMTGDAAYGGMELQILDNEAPIYENLKEYQYHGSVYGVIPAKRGFLNPVGEWNYQEVIADGDHIKITLNGEVILDGNIREAAKNGTTDKEEHPGLLNKEGHICFLGHGSVVKFRNIRVKKL
jgi:HEAT repeat protein